MNLLILGTSILAGSTDAFVENDDAFFINGVVYPKNAMSGYEVVQADLPVGKSIADCDWIAGNAVAKVVLPSLSDYEAAVQNMLDAKAKQFGYDDIKSACTYAGDPDPIFNDQGTKLKAWRSQCWRKCYDVSAQVESHQIDQPTVDELIGMMPESPL